MFLTLPYIFHTSGGVNWHFAESDLIELSVFYYLHYIITVKRWCWAACSPPVTVPWRAPW